jgi:hypothetical protein
MPYRFISRRRFVKNTVGGGLACSLGLGPNGFAESMPDLSVATDGLTFKAIGDAEHGYGVELLYRGQPIARHNQGG